jgi:flagellar protein FlgJ
VPNSSSSEIGSVSQYTDVAALGALRAGAKHAEPQTMREVARQFEGIFVRMMLQSMRDASPGDPLFGSSQSDMYRDMYDGQLSLQLTQGKGIGLADLLMRQLQAQPAAPAPSAAVDAAPPSRAAFVDFLRPAAERAARELGVSARTIIAHAALETGWGRSLPTDSAGRSSQNFFGIKAIGSAQPGVPAKTTEYEQGRAVQRTERFRSYASVEAGIADYVRLLGLPRYSAARGVGDDPAAFGAALQRAGYATDPDYARKLAAVARHIGDA